MMSISPVSHNSVSYPIPIPREDADELPFANDDVETPVLSPATPSEEAGSLSSVSSLGHTTPVGIPYTVSELMRPFLEHRERCGAELPNFDDRFFDTHYPKFHDRFSEYLAYFMSQIHAPRWQDQDAFGFVQAVPLNPEVQPKIAFFTDVHGDLMHLCELLYIYQKMGYLDEAFRCRPGFYIAVLGDYCDRGYYGMEVLLLLMVLKLSNPEQVFLLRGNHEDIRTNRFFQKSLPGVEEDFYFSVFVLQCEAAARALVNFYESLPLSVYFHCNGYVLQAVHGLPEFTFDPTPFADEITGPFLIVPKTRQFSDRFKELLSIKRPLRLCAERVHQAVENYFATCRSLNSHERKLPHERLQDSMWAAWEPEYTTFCCGDVAMASESPQFGPIVKREWSMPASWVVDYLCAYSIPGWHQRVLVKGHQHFFDRFIDRVSGRTLITLPGSDEHRLYLGDSVPAVSCIIAFDGQKEASIREIRRRPGHKTHQITDPIALFASNREREKDRFDEWTIVSDEPPYAPLVPDHDKREAVSPAPASAIA